MIPTPFETNARASTWDEEVQFWADLQAASPRVSVFDVGVASDGRPVRLIGVGYPAAPRVQDSRGTAPYLAMAAVHASETSGREAMMAVARDLAFTTDLTELEMLEESAFWAIPTISPSGTYPTMTRENSNGVDINTDYPQLTQTETRAVLGVLRDLQPSLCLDCHQGSTEPVRAQISGMTHPGITRGLRGISNDFSHHLSEWVRANYGAASEWPQSDRETTARQAFGLSHSICVLIETNPTDTMELRVTIMAGSIREGYNYRHDNREELLRAINASRYAKSGDPMWISDILTLDPAPTGYRLTAAQMDATVHLRAAHQIHAIDEPSGTFLIPTNQAGMRMFRYGIDPGARYTVIDPTTPVQRVGTATPPPAQSNQLEARSFGPLIINGQRADITRAVTLEGGQIRSVTNTPYVKAQPGPFITEDPNDPGVFLLNGFTEDPDDPGTFLTDPGIVEDASDPGTFINA